MILFVYYKCEPAQYPELSQQLAVLRMRVMATYPHVSLRLMNRPDVDDKGRVTYMEMYEPIQCDEVLTFGQFLEKNAIALKMPVPRATEQFENWACH